MINVPKKKSEYLSMDAGPALERIEEIVKIQNFIGDVKPSDVLVTVYEFGDTLHSLEDFKPDYYIDGDEINTVEHIDNLLYTIELNPPEKAILSLPNGDALNLLEDEETNNALDECYDILSKLQDCIDTLRSGNKLDEMQELFLRMHNILN